MASAVAGIVLLTARIGAVDCGAGARTAAAAVLAVPEGGGKKGIRAQKDVVGKKKVSADR